MKEKVNVKRIDLAGFLIKPTQRITKYPLLIRDIIKYTEKDHPDYEKLLQMEAKLHGVLEEINEKTRLQESVDLFLSIQSSMKWTNKAYDLVASRCLIYNHGKIRWELICPSISPEPLARGNYVFVINHFILACNERSGQFVELATFLIHTISIEEQDSSTHDLCLNIKRTDGVLETFIIHTNDFLDFQSWFTNVKKCCDSAPLQPSSTQLIEIAPSRRQTTDVSSIINQRGVGGSGERLSTQSWVVPPIRLPSARSEGTASPPTPNEEKRTKDSHSRPVYMTLRTARSSKEQPVRSLTSMTFKDDTTLGLNSPPAIISDSSMHHPKVHHARTTSTLQMSDINDINNSNSTNTPYPNSDNSNNRLSPMIEGQTPLLSQENVKDKKHKDKKHHKDKKEKKDEKKTKDPSPPLSTNSSTRQRSNDVVLIHPSSINNEQQQIPQLIITQPTPTTDSTPR